MLQDARERGIPGIRDSYAATLADVRRRRAEREITQDEAEVIAGRAKREHVVKAAGTAGGIAQRLYSLMASEAATAGHRYEQRTWDPNTVDASKLSMWQTTIKHNLERSGDTDASLAYLQAIARQDRHAALAVWGLANELKRSTRDDLRRLGAHAEQARRWHLQADEGYRAACAEQNAVVDAVGAGIRDLQTLATGDLAGRPLGPFGEIQQGPSAASWASVFSVAADGSRALAWDGKALGTRTDGDGERFTTTLYTPANTEPQFRVARIDPDRREPGAGMLD
jgi:hypothetical protein